jgi:signal transduction histidine kinase
LLNWNKSIRGRLLGALALSFVIADLVMMAVANYVNQFPYPYLFLAPSGVFVVVFLFVFFVLILNTVRYVRTIAEGLMHLAKGNMDYRIAQEREDELGIVVRNINYMADQLQSMMEKERQIEKSKMELITHISHDLRTPLTSIIGYVNLLKQDDYQNLADHKRYVNNAYSKLQQLQKLIDDLFEYTRLMSGDVKLVFKEIDLSDMLEQMIIEYEPIARKYGLELRKDWEAAPMLGYVNVEKLARAIDNLLMNALKFSDKPGKITVWLAEREGQIVLAVENKGKPVTKEQEKQLFDRFYKAEESRNDHHMPTGSGLGLSIAKNIVELHGGRVGLEHYNGHYKFYIELPRAAGI